MCRGCTYAYTCNTTQTAYTQYYSTSSEPSLIHMNGRAYAPSLQRFLSPDPVLQAPTNAQNHNRYAYCLNNPLRYTDPSGYTAAPLVPRWPEGYDPPDHVDDPWGGSSGWARAMTPGMTYGWWAGLPTAAYGPAFYAYFGSDGSRNAPPSSHFDYVYGAGGERGRVEWKYRWESKPGKIQADGGIEVIGYKEWYVEWTSAGENAERNANGFQQHMNNANSLTNGFTTLWGNAARMSGYAQLAKGINWLGTGVSVITNVVVIINGQAQPSNYVDLGITIGIALLTPVPIVAIPVAATYGGFRIVFGESFDNWINAPQKK